MLHLSQRRHGRCQSLPNDVTFSAIVTHRNAPVSQHGRHFAGSHLAPPPLFLDVYYSPKYTLLLQRGHRLASPEKVVMLPAVGTLQTFNNTEKWKKTEKGSVNNKSFQLGVKCTDHGSVLKYCVWNKPAPMCVKRELLSNEIDGILVPNFIHSL